MKCTLLVGLNILYGKRSCNNGTFNESHCHFTVCFFERSFIYIISHFTVCFFERSFIYIIIGGGGGGGIRLNINSYYYYNTMFFYQNNMFQW